MAQSLKTLFQNTNAKNRIEVFSFNQKKFKIEVRHRNGDPCGFNTNCCLAVMRDDGTFSNIADNHTVGVKYKNLYFLNDNDQSLIDVNDNCIKAFKDFVKKVYA
jgi:hypothetical protein